MRSSGFFCNSLPLLQEIAILPPEMSLAAKNCTKFYIKALCAFSPKCLQKFLMTQPQGNHNCISLSIVPLKTSLPRRKGLPQLSAAGNTQIGEVVLHPGMLRNIIFPILHSEHL